MNISSLGELKVERKSFKQIEHKLEELIHSKWHLLNEYQKQQRISDLLLKCIFEESEQFVLRQVADFIEKVEQKKICDQYTIYIFETFLNHYSKLSLEENLKVRAKITGKNIPRNEYQGLFPIGMDKYYEGPHFITAHGSPDLDTMVASFWGWLDAFSARVSTGCHFWNIPGGPPKGVVEKKLLFTDVFGEQFFSNFSKDKTALSITAFDLFTKKGLKIVDQHALLTDLESDQEALIVTQDDGVYVGDWKGFDSDNFRRITSAIFAVLRSFEANFQHAMIQAFSKQHLEQKEAKQIVRNALEATIEKNEAFIELPAKLKNQVHLFLTQVVQLQEGVNSTFEEFFIIISKHGKQFSKFDLKAFILLYEDGIYDQKGHLIDQRSMILKHIDEAVLLLKEIMETVRKVFASFHFAVITKKLVFSQTDDSISSLSDLEEIRSRIGVNPYITVNLHHDSEVKLPLGVIYAHELQKNILGTVTCRDFTNKEETKIPGYLEVISGLDHHKMVMNSSSPMTLKIMDVQSANTLVAMEAFAINDRYSFGGIDPKQIDQLIEQAMKEEKSSYSIIQKLFQRKANMQKYKETPIHKEREILEYLHFLFAILDDTDLLSKMTLIDVECVSSLVNRLRSLQLGKEVEVVSFSDLDRNDPSFIKVAVERLLQNEQLYSLYKTIYQKREKAVEEHIEAILKNPTFPLFEDTKVQNGCARVGQKKLYSSNIEAFQKQKEKVLSLWVKESKAVVEKNPQVDLHMLMISTIASCEDVYKGAKVQYKHQDELWFYVPDSETARLHLKLFLSQFQRNKMMVKHASTLRIKACGKLAQELKVCFEESFLSCPIEIGKGGEDCVILYHDAGILNSRKSMISPFLPVV